MSELLKSNRRGVLPARGGGGEAGFVDPADDDGAFFGGAHAGGWAGEWAGEPNPPGTFEVSARARRSLLPHAGADSTDGSETHTHESSTRTRALGSPQFSSATTQRHSREPCDQATDATARESPRETHTMARLFLSLPLSLPLSPPSLSLLLALEDERVPPDDPQGCVPQIATRVV